MAKAKAAKQAAKADAKALKAKQGAVKKETAKKVRLLRCSLRLSAPAGRHPAFWP